MASPAGGSISNAMTSPLATALAVTASPAAPGGGNGTHPPKAGGGGGICIDLVSPHTPRGVVFNNLVRSSLEDVESSDFVAPEKRKTEK